MNLKKIGGFTLIEILTVIVILGVLAGLAVPVYVGQVEKARGSEAIDHLNATRASMIRYFADKNTYVGASIPADGSAGTTDYNPNTVVGGQVLFFDYTVGNLAADTFTLTATRKTGTVKGVAAPSGAGPHSITLTQDGTLGKNGAYA